MIKSTDKLVSKSHSIYMSLQVRKNPKLEERAFRAVRFIELTLDAYRKVLDIPSNVKFRICTFKGEKTQGLYVSDTKTVCILPRADLEEFAQTLSHELIHAEQFKTGKLEHIKVPRVGYRLAWKGNIGSKGTTYKSYRSQPWEVEAFGRSKEVTDKVYELLSDS